jgi:hypothetical protein
MFAKKSITQRGAAPQKSAEEKAAAKQAAREKKIKHLVRSNGACAEISIAREGIVRNEMYEDGKLYAKWQKIPTNIAIFHPSVYNFMTDFAAMSEEARKALLATKVFEIVVMEKDLQSKPNDKSVLTQIQRMAPYLPQIRKLVITIQIPDKYIADDDAFRASSTRSFLDRLVKELQVCRSLTWMPVTLHLPKSVPHMAKDGYCEYFPVQYLHPFFPFGFRNWCIKSKRERGLTEDADEDMVALITERYFIFNR